MPKISVIIPVFNTGKYLAECLDSVLCQTLVDIEIICINDESTDNSADVLADYAAKDKRIKIINQKNAGVIVARNNGIAHSTADLIYPLDSDDVISPDTLSVLYDAFMHGCGDVITSCVVKFGAETGEMILPKPNKLNFSHANCSVNAALFRKSDFYAAGGYDIAYKTALEDYDLWLNFIYRQNLRFYRVPQKLFYYRIKKKSESRNMQNRDKHNDIVNSFYIKYPPMRKWLRVYRLIKPFIKLKRFVFRTESGFIKIFKIPVYKISKKYDCVIPVGAACFVPDALKYEKLRSFSGPFDWMFGSDVITRLKIIKNQFNHYFDMPDFEYVGENPDNGKLVYKNKRTGIIYNHDFPHGDFATTFPIVKSKYERRVCRTFWHLKTDAKVLLVYAELGQSGNPEQIMREMENINKVYGADIDLLYINHNENIPVGKYIRPMRISPHVIYSEYYYKTFPTETRMARKIVQKLLKKAVI